jgi:hypothetical protein
LPSSPRADHQTLIVTLRLRIPAVFLALLGQFGGLFGFPIVAGRGSASDAPVTACGCSAAQRDAGLCCCHRTELPPCCRKKAVKNQADSRHPTTVVWVNAAVRQKCLDDSTTPSGQRITPGVAPDTPADPDHEHCPAGRVALSDHSPLTAIAPPDDPPPRVN